MCTSIVIRTEDDKNLLARTFDFDDELTNTMYVIPRNYPIQLSSYNNKIYSKYATIGMGMIMIKYPMLYDGINEKGLLGATLYLETATVNEPKIDKINISSANFLFWMLSQFETIDEIIEQLPNINIIFDSTIEGENYNPLHWIISDRSNRTIIIEQENKLVVHESNLGVMANYPNYCNQLNNLCCYNYVSTRDDNEGLPGGTSSYDRFVRAAYLKKYSIKAKNEIEAITVASKILDTVAVSKGASSDPMEYTHTTSIMCSQSLIYYCYTYDNNQIQAFSLLHEDLNVTDIKKYELHNEQAIEYRN